MIPYEELCSALARWREKNGLANGPSARLPQGAVIQPPAAESPAGRSPDPVFGASVSSGFGDTLPTEPGAHADPPTTRTPAAPFADAAGTTPLLPDPDAVLDDTETIIEGDDPGDGPTGQHVAGDPLRDITNELELDDLEDDKQD